MVEAMLSKEIDGFTAGEPWGSAAIEAGLAEAVAASERLWQRGVEKVLTFRQDWLDANPDLVDGLLRALAGAAAWCDAPDNREDLAQLLARQDYVDQPAEIIERALKGQIVARAGEVPVELPDFMLFSREATSFPWRSQALWIYSQFVRWGMAEASDEAQAAAAAVFRPDIYRRALADSDMPMPGASMKVEGAVAAPLAIGARKGSITLGPDRFFDGRSFDPDHIADYLASFVTPR
jgi:NitT/TauT family transport system ATP-binding protein